MTPATWDLLKNHVTKTANYTLEQAIICAVKFKGCHVGVYAGDIDTYYDFSPVFHPLILDCHNLAPDFTHTPDMDYTKITERIEVSSL